MKLKDRRRHNLSILVAEFGSIAAVANRSGASEKYLSQILNQARQGETPRGLGDAVADKLERGCGKPPGWMDADHRPVAGSPAHSLIDRILAMTWDEQQLALLAGFLDLIEKTPAPPTPPAAPLKRATVGKTPLKKRPRKLP